jgi:hypothetical protein
MHLLKEMYDNVPHMETVDIPEEFFNKTFIRHLTLGTGEAPRRNELVHALHENHSEYRFNGVRCKGD